MTERLLKVLPLGVFGGLIAILTAGFGAAQEPIPLLPPGGQPAPVPRLPGADPEPQPLPPPPAQQDPGDGIDVLAKGPVHEAFATTAEAPAVSPVVPKQPPEPIEELPPDQKPAGDNVQWIPGYWSWDEENTRFIWVSGFWRQPPPGRVWVPGSWREAKGGWQWASGFWQEVRTPLAQQPNEAVQPIEYLPEPPASIEAGPSVAAPTATCFYVPGSWVWRGRYVWRPGVWVEYRTNWVWVPAHFRWTPLGYVFVDGYWDYPPATRGVLFAPVVFVRPVRPAFVYTPVYVVSEPCMVGALFVRRGYSCYYFGDYFEPRYVTVGYSAWCGTYTRTGFSVGFGVGRSWGYDPLWSYYSITYRDTPTWHRGMGDLYHGRYRGDLVRPPTTLVQQNTVINNVTKVNVTNVTNNITVVNGATTVNNKDVTNVAMVAPLKVAPDLSRTKFEPVSADARRNEAAAAKQIREVAVQRTRLETAALAQAPAAPAPGQPAPPAQPKSIKLDVPKTAVARAQVQDEKKAPPPNPLRVNTSPGAKLDPPKVDPKPPTGNPPVTLPKADGPKIDPKPPVVGAPVNPLPKSNPPKVDIPKVDPKPTVTLPKVDVPKIDPKPAGNSPATPLPKIDIPKADPKPPVSPAPKVEIPKLDPKPPVLPPAGHPPVGAPVNPLPKVDPKLPGGPLPKLDPKPPGLPPVGNPPKKADPPKKPDPKSEPPKPPLAVAPPVTLPKAPVVVAPPVPPKAAPVINPPAQPRPTVIAPAAQPPKVVQPPKPAPKAEQPKAKPAPPGKPNRKERGRDDE